MKPTEYLADFIAKTLIEDVPDEAFQKSKWSITDCIAVILGGLQHEVGTTIVSFVKDLGGIPTSTILGDGHRTSAPWAAYANGTLAHALDYDDTPNGRLAAHPTAPVLPAILAMGEKVGASGKDILLSYVLGVEVEAKVGMAMKTFHYNLGWHPTGTLGTFGATAACCKLMKLNKDQTLMAFGIAGSEASAIKQNFGTMTKPLHVGQASKNGVMSALLASRGWTADREILEGHFGFWNLFSGREQWDLQEMTDNLGKPFEVIHPGNRFKKYPCCGSIFPSLHVFSLLRQESPFQPEEVERIECQIHPERIHVLVHSNPQTGLEAKFSLEYCLATMLLKGGISIAHFTDEHVADQKNKTFLSRIKTIQNPNLNPWDVHLRILLRDGRVFEKSGGRAPGITTWDELVSKYRDCLEGTLSSAQIRQSLEMIQNIETIKDISEMIKVLVAKLPTCSLS
jgi:2-methylcitrate dehydratase PrpD